MRYDKKKVMKRIGINIIMLCLASLFSYAQDVETNSLEAKKAKTKEKAPILLDYLVINGDTVPMIEMEPISVLAPKVFKNKREERRYWRLVRNIRKVYPYAKLAGEKMAKYEKELDGKGNWSKKRIMKRVEQELLDEYGSEIKDLTITQGHILIKLIDRETGDTGYEIIQEMRGRLSAMFWQGIATLFESDLKSEYDPIGEDQEIEEIVRRIELGQL